MSHSTRSRRAGVLSLLLATLAAAGLFASGCAATVGDGCTTNRDCATGQECDTAPPGGYCLVLGCRPNSCPSEAWCTTFPLGDRTRTFCLRKCKSDGDCRSGYACRTDTGAAGGVCYIAASMP